MHSQTGLIIGPHNYLREPKASTWASLLGYGDVAELTFAPTLQVAVQSQTAVGRALNWLAQQRKLRRQLH